MSDCSQLLHEFRDFLCDDSDGHRLAEFLAKRNGPQRHRPRRIFGDLELKNASYNVRVEKPQRVAAENTHENGMQHMQVVNFLPQRDSPRRTIYSPVEAAETNTTSSAPASPARPPRTLSPRDLISRSGGASTRDHLRRLSLRRLTEASEGRQALEKYFEMTTLSSGFSPPIASTPMTDKAVPPKKSAIGPVVHSPITSYSSTSPVDAVANTPAAPNHPHRPDLLLTFQVADSSANHTQSNNSKRNSTATRSQQPPSPPQTPPTAQSPTSNNNNNAFVSATPVPGSPRSDHPTIIIPVHQTFNITPKKSHCGSMNCHSVNDCCPIKSKSCRVSIPAAANSVQEEHMPDNSDAAHSRRTALPQNTEWTDDRSIGTQQTHDSSARKVRNKTGTTQSLCAPLSAAMLASHGLASISPDADDDEGEEVDGHDQHDTAACKTAAAECSGAPLNLAATRASRQTRQKTQQSSSKLNVMSPTVINQRHALRKLLTLNKAPCSPINGEKFATELKSQLKSLSNTEILDLRKRNSLGAVYAVKVRKSTNAQKAQALSRQLQLEQEIAKELDERDLLLQQGREDSGPTAEFDGPIMLPAPLEFRDIEISAPAAEQLLTQDEGGLEMVNEAEAEAAAGVVFETTTQSRCYQPSLIYDSSEAVSFTATKKSAKLAAEEDQRRQSDRERYLKMKQNVRKRRSRQLKRSLYTKGFSDGEESTLANLTISLPPPPAFVDRSPESHTGAAVVVTPLASSRNSSVRRTIPGPPRSPPPSNNDNNGLAGTPIQPADQDAASAASVTTNMAITPQSVALPDEDAVFKKPRTPKLPKKYKRGAAQKSQAEADSADTDGTTTSDKPDDGDSTGNSTLRRSKRGHVPLKNNWSFRTTNPTPLYQVMYVGDLLRHLNKNSKNRRINSYSDLLTSLEGSDVMSQLDRQKNSKKTTTTRKTAPKRLAAESSATSSGSREVSNFFGDVSTASSSGSAVSSASRRRIASVARMDPLVEEEPTRSDEEEVAHSDMERLETNRKEVENAQSTIRKRPSGRNAQRTEDEDDELLVPALEQLPIPRSEPPESKRSGGQRAASKSSKSTATKRRLKLKAPQPAAAEAENTTKQSALEPTRSDEEEIAHGDMELVETNRKEPENEQPTIRKRPSGRSAQRTEEEQEEQLLVPPIPSFEPPESKSSKSTATKRRLKLKAPQPPATASTNTTKQATLAPPTTTSADESRLERSSILLPSAPVEQLNQIFDNLKKSTQAQIQLDVMRGGGETTPALPRSTMPHGSALSHTPSRKVRVRMQRLPLQDTPALSGKETSSTTNGSSTASRSATPAGLMAELLLWLQGVPDLPLEFGLGKTFPEIHCAAGGVLIFNDLEGIDCAFYNAKNDQRWSMGYLRFKPKQHKPTRRSKSYDLQFVVMTGEFRIETSHENGNFVAGEIVTINKGLRYSIKNESDDIAILMIIKK